MACADRPTCRASPVDIMGSRIEVQCLDVVGLIIGVVIGGVAFLALLAFSVWVLRKKFTSVAKLQNGETPETYNKLGDMSI
jgi:hypothetical protein